MQVDRPRARIVERDGLRPGIGDVEPNDQYDRLSYHRECGLTHTDGIGLAWLGHVKSIWWQDWERSWKLRRVPSCLIYRFGEVTERQNQITLGARF